MLMLAMAMAFVLPACGTAAKKASAAKALSQPPAPKLYDWRGDDLEGEVAIEISLSDQKAYISIDGQDAGWTYVATGRDNFDSPTGKFKIIEKKEEKYSNRYGMIENAAGEVIDRDATAGREPIPVGGRFAGAPMPYWMRLTNYGVGMHVGQIPNPGHPASHGCIRLPQDMAEILFDRVKLGTPVIISGEIPRG